MHLLVNLMTNYFGSLNYQKMCLIVLNSGGEKGWFMCGTGKIFALLDLKHILLMLSI